MWNTHLKKRLILPNSKTASSSPITLTPSQDENAEKFIIGDDDDQIQKARLDERPDFMEENVFLDSPSSSSSSSSATKSQETTFQESEELMWELDDVNLWEIWESLDPALLDSNYTTSRDDNDNNNIGGEKSEGELVDEEFGKWLRCIENELGLTDQLQ